MAGNNIDWQTGMDKLVQATSHVLNSSWRTDVKFDVGPDGKSRVIQGHKFMLAMRSPVFEAMFYGNIPETGDTPIRIPDVCPDVFQALLKYIYTDETNIGTFAAALNMSYVASKYMLQGIVKKCKEIIFRDVSAQNACTAFEFAKLFSDQELKNKCNSLFVNETETVFRSKCFLNASAETLCAILCLENMKIPSEEVCVLAMLAWGRYQCQLQGIEPNSTNVRKELTEAGAIFKVRYLTMTMEDFTASVVMSGIFTDEEVLAILMNISVPGSKAMPLSLKNLPLNLKARNMIMPNQYCKLYDQSFMHSNTSSLFPTSASSSFVLHPNWLTTVTSETIYITVNRDIFLHGIVFIGQKPDPNNFYFPVHQDYSERVHLQLHGNGLNQLAETRLEKSVHWEEHVEMNFPTPVIIRKERCYKMSITFSSGTKGYYRKMKLMKEYTQKDGLEFTFRSFGLDDVTAVDSIVFS